MLLEQRILEERVHDEVVAHTPAVATDRALPQDDHIEPALALFEQLALRLVFGFGVRADRLHGRVLVEDFARCEAVVDRAAGAEGEALHAHADARFAQFLRGDHVHLPVGVGIEVGCRVVREASQVADGVHAVEVAVLHLADVAGDEFDVRELVKADVAPEKAIEDAYPVAALDKLFHQHDSDVSSTACDADKLAHPLRPSLCHRVRPPSLRAGGRGSSVKYNAPRPSGVAGVEPQSILIGRRDAAPAGRLHRFVPSMSRKRAS